jgi:steroid delta-isomerase-like uncharacterized protein
MSVQENSRIIEKIFETINAHDIGRYSELLSEDVVVRSTFGPEPLRGKEAFSRQVAGFFAAFSDYHIELKNAVVADDQFACELVFSGTHDGPFNPGPDLPPIPPTGKQARTRGIFVATISEGKIIEIHQYPDRLGLMMQLGLMSPPGSE